MLGLHRHVSLVRRRQPSFISRSLLTVQLKQEASRPEPKSLRPLQAEEEYVLSSFLGIPITLFAHPSIFCPSTAVRCTTSLLSPPNQFVSLTSCRRWDPFRPALFSLFIVCQRMYLHRVYQGALTYPVCSWSLLIDSSIPIDPRSSETVSHMSFFPFPYS